MALLWLAGLVLYGSAVLADTRIPAAPELASLPAWAQERVAPIKRALVVGISNYKHANPLSTPLYDAELVSNALKRLDPHMAVTQLSGNDLSRDELLERFEIFRDSLRPGDIALVYYSGHGIELGGINYLVPADAEFSRPGDETSTYISVPYLIKEIQGTGTGTTVIILDACRSNPFSPPVADEEHLDPKKPIPASPVPAIASNQYRPVKTPPQEAPKGFLVVFAAQAGRPSFSLLVDDTPDIGSIFTRSLLRLLTTENKPAYSVFNLTSGAVARLTANRQEPLVASFNAGEIMFMDNQNLAREELETWTRTVASTSDDELIYALNKFIDNYPAGPFTAAARKRLSLLQATNVAFSRSMISSERDVGMLAGSLKTPAVKDSFNTKAFARYSVNVRDMPRGGNSRVLTDLKQGQQVEVLHGKTPRGWAQVMLEDGQIGYVGSVSAQNKPVEVISLAASELPAAGDLAILERWRGSVEQGRSSIEIKVGSITDPNPTQASRIALLQGLRIRALLEAQGMTRSRLALRLASPDVPLDTVTISLMKEGAL
ncbi:MAG: caspase family protein [Pseudomonas sp.]